MNRIALELAAVIGSTMVAIPFVSAYMHSGRSDYGSPLKIETRINCKWGNPGANPWEGNTTGALMIMGLDQESAETVARRIAEKDTTKRVAIANDSIKRAGEAVYFAPGMTMAFGKSVCFNTRADLFRGSVQFGNLYEHKSGEVTYYIAVPDACGNVTRIFPGIPPKTPPVTTNPPGVYPPITPRTWRFESSSLHQRWSSEGGCMRFSDFRQLQGSSLALVHVA